MAQTIKIKRTAGTGKPTNVAQGELFYAYGTGGTYGKRLSIGNTSGGGNTPEIVGGSYYTNIIDTAATANTASKLVLRDSSGNFAAGTITATFTGNLTGNVTGDVTGSAGTVTSISAHDTDALSEGTSNLYHTTARARGAISATGDLNYEPSTGVISFSAAAQAVTSVNSATGAVTLDTDDVAEGSSNVYYTDARTDTRVDTILKHSNHSNITCVAGSGGQLILTAAAQYGDTDVQAYVSGGIGVTLNSSGEFRIGQAVDTTSNVTFGTVDCGNITTTGTLEGPTTFTIDPATHGDDTGTVVIAGDLTVQGTTTTVNSTTVALGDNILVLNKDEAGTPSANAGLEVERGTATNVSLLWNETGDNWTVSDGSATSTLLTAANFGSTYTGDIDGGTYS
jgi:hypothetical protein